MEANSGKSGYCFVLGILQKIKENRITTGEQMQSVRMSQSAIFVT